MMNAAIGRLQLSITVAPAPQAVPDNKEDTAVEQWHRRDSQQQAAEADRNRWLSSAPLRGGWRL